MPDTPGSIAYEGYRRACPISKFTGDKLPPWAEIDPELIPYWEAAGQRVLDCFAPNAGPPADAEHRKAAAEERKAVAFERIADTVEEASAKVIAAIEADTQDRAEEESR